MKLIKSLGKIYPKENSKRKYLYGIYECPICNKHFRVETHSVDCWKATKCRSCASSRRKINPKHGLTNTKIHNVWTSIKQRTNNENSKAFGNYGARGITMCDEWKNDFVAFYNWAMTNGYKDGLSIDRIDNDGNYEPKNCRWVFRSVQARNTRLLRKTNTTGYRGVGFNKSRNKWTAQIIVNYKNIFLGHFSNAIDAAKAYDKYVIDNNLEHTINNV